MSNTFLTIDKNTPWVLPATPSNAMRRALLDLKNDWYMVFGSAPFMYTSKEQAALHKGPALLFAEAAGIPAPTDRESFLCRAQGSDIVLVGADELGMLYAIYTFSKEVLGVDPWYYFNDFLPKKKTEIRLSTDFDLSHGSPSFKYRGFFINNEDMISGSFPDPLEENFIDLYTFDKICELILRLGGNLIAPGTRPYPDETVRAVAGKRGLYLNDHHVTPLGLNVYMWPAELPYSYVTHPEILEDMWNKCIQEEKQYKMLWTISFRGKGDGPFWNVDPAAPESDEERAEVINRAIQKQVDMIRAVQPEADIMFNMYFEQAALCRKGLLKIPEGVIRVWPNDGAGVMSDGGEAAPGDGAYFHITACRNRICEAVSPEQIYTELGRFQRVGANSCLIMNIGNIRPFPVSISAVMDFTYDASRYGNMPPKEAMEDHIRRYAAAHYAEAADEVAPLYIDYFRASNFRKPRPDMAPYGYALECLGMYASDWKPNYNQVLTDFRQSLYMHEMARKYIRVLRDGEEFTDIFEKTVDDFNSIVYEDTAYLPELSVMAHALESRIPAAARLLYRENLLLQIDTINQINLAMEHEGISVKAYMQGDKRRAIAEMRTALSHMEAALEVLHSGETEKWPVFYQYECLSCFFHTRDLLACVLSLLLGEGERPVRPFVDFGGHGKQIYFYQYLPENQEGYPFLKKAKQPRGGC